MRFAIGLCLFALGCPENGGETDLPPDSDTDVDTDPVEVAGDARYELWCAPTDAPGLKFTVGLLGEGAQCSADRDSDLSITIEVYDGFAPEEVKGNTYTLGTDPNGEASGVVTVDGVGTAVDSGTVVFADEVSETGVLGGSYSLTAGGTTFEGAFSASDCRDEETFGGCG